MTNTKKREILAGLISELINFDGTEILRGWDDMVLENPKIIFIQTARSWDVNLNGGVLDNLCVTYFKAIAEINDYIINQIEERIIA